MQFIILPLSYRTKEEKQEKMQETANRIRRRIDMTQVAQIFEEEKRQAVEAVEKEKKRIEKEKQQIEEEKQRTENALKEEREKMRQVVIKMIQKKYSADEIISYVSSYSREEVEQLRKEVML